MSWHCVCCCQPALLPLSPPPPTHPLLLLQVVVCDPMDPDEAIYSLEAVGHDFYVYRDKASNELRVSRAQAGGLATRGGG